MLRIAQAQQEEARLAFGQSLLNAGSEVNNAITQYQTAREKSEFYNLLNVQLSQVANRFTEIQSVISLYHALGGGRN